MSPASDKATSNLENSVSLINLNSSCDSTYSDILDTSSSSYSRSYRNFRSNEEYLWAMKEDLAEWLNNLYEININADNFIEKLETGVILCRHANNVIAKALSIGHKFNESISGNGNGNDAGKGGDSNNNNQLIYKGDELRYRANAKPKTFQARDNVSNFISWCKSLKIHDCLLFETDDLVLGKNEKSFILCLLEVTRKCTAFGMVAPLIVQMEQEIDRELNEEQFISDGHLTPSSTSDDQSDELSEDESSLVTISTSPDSGYMGSLITTVPDKDNQSIESNQSSTINSSNDHQQSTTIKSESQIVTNNLKCLHERVVDLLNRCTCPSQFPMVKVADGKYRVGNPKVLIYVRILRNHVMVRVGGGWDTLGHYLDRHDPCRCRIGTINKTSTSPNGLSNSPINKEKDIQSMNTPTNQVNHNQSNNVKSSLFNRKSTNGSQIWINYNRQPYPSNEPQYTSYDNLRFSSGSMISIYPNLMRRDSIGLTESSCSLNSFSEGSDRQPSRSSQYSDDSSSSHSSKVSSSTVTSSMGSSPRSSISSSTGGLNHLSTGQLTSSSSTSSSSSSSSLHFNHHHNQLNRHHLMKSHQRDQIRTNHKLINSTDQKSLHSSQFINNQSKVRSGIAKYIGLTNHQTNYPSPRPITNLSKVNSCTNIRFCHQTTSSSASTIKQRKF